MNGLGESIIIPKFKSKMSVSVSVSDIMFEAQLNSSKLIEWTIINKSKEPWPCQPLLFNQTTNEKLPIQHILKPDETIQLKYLFKVPENATRGILIQKLQLVNPYSMEKFGDPITIVCQLISESLTDEDLSFYESKNSVINGINTKAGNAVDMIDELLNGLDESRIDSAFDGQND